MPNEQVDWVSLDDVMAAADRGLAPIGPELAGFVVLETAQRLRELGGVLDASILALGTSGHVALTAPPKRGDEDLAVQRLRELLGTFLSVTTSATPALRQVARRRDHNALALLCRELEGALIPLNRAASRRAVARVARATLEAIDAGRLEPGSAVDRAPSEPPRVEVAPRRSSPPPLPPPVVVAKPETPPPVVVMANAETPPPVEVDDRTPYTAAVFDEIGNTPLEELSAQLETESPPQIEIVSQLPPLVAESDDSQKFAIALDVEPVVQAEPVVQIEHVEKRPDRVAALIESFEVSRRRDDRALSGDLKAMVGIETSVPPAVTVNVRLRPRASDTVEIDHDAPREPTVIVSDPLPPPPKRRSMLAFFGLAAVACAGLAIAAKPAALDAILGPPLPPPGDNVVAPAAQNASAPRIPIVCEASMVLEGAPSNAEVLRRIGATPLTVTMPMHVPFDLVATMDGHAPRRAHVDASALWQQEPTGARLDVPFALDAVQGNNEAKWPTATGVTALRLQGDAARGLLRATSTPNGAAIWVVVDPTAIGAVPCGGAVDLMVVPGEGKPARAIHVDWATFSGSPPRATAKY